MSSLTSTADVKQSTFLAGLSNWQILLVLFMFMCLGVWIKNMLITSDLIFNTYNGSMPFDQIIRSINFKNEFWWLSYILTLVLFFFKVTFFGICIFLGCFQLKWPLFKIKTLWHMRMFLIHMMQL